MAEAFRNNAHPRYFCHECKMETVLNQQEEYACSRCNGSFIEELDPQPNSDAQSPPPVSTFDPDRDVDETESSPSAPPAPSQNPAFPGHPFTTYYQRNPNGHTIVTMSTNNGETPQQRLFLQDVGRPFGQRSQNGPAHPLEQLINQLFGNLGGNLFGGGGVHGNPGDYVWGPGGLDAIITQLLNNVEGSGPPPAEESTINNLPSTLITQEQVDNKVECSVCFDDFSVDEEAKVLPCKHHYHKQCIEPWLKMHGTCPVCRKDLSGEDTSTQEYMPEIPDNLSELANSQNEAEASSLGSNTNQGQTTASEPEAPRDFVEDDLE